MLFWIALFIFLHNRSQYFDFELYMCHEYLRVFLCDFCQYNIVAIFCNDSYAHTALFALVCCHVNFLLIVNLTRQRSRCLKRQDGIKNKDRRCVSVKFLDLHNQAV